MDETTEQSKSSKADHLKPYQYKKGQSGNPLGRSVSPGESLKEYARRKLAGMTEEEKEEYFHGIDKKTIWEMSEGKPETKTDITSKGESINQILVKFIDAEDTDN